MGRSNLRCHLLGLLVVLIGTYPASPTLYMLLKVQPQLMFVLLSIAIIFLALRASGGAIACRSAPHEEVLRWLVFLMMVFLIVKIVTHQSTLAVRDLLILLIVLSMMRMSIETLMSVVRVAIYLMTAMLLLSMVVSLISYYMGLLDLRAWSVGVMDELGASHPLRLRQESGDNYLFPAYLAAIPLDESFESFGFGLPFYQRQPLIFTEWTYTWYYLGPLLWVMLVDSGMRFRGVVKTVFSGALVVALSIWGAATYLGLLFVLLLLKLPRLLFKSLFLALLAVVAMTLFFVPLEDIVSIFGGSKVEQVLFYSQTIDFARLATPLGVTPEEYALVDFWSRTYGIVDILFVYGVAGFGVYLAYLAFAIAMSTYAIWKHGKNPKIRAWAFAVLVSLSVGLKLSIYASLFQFILILVLAKRLGSLREAERKCLTKPRAIRQSSFAST